MQKKCHGVAYRFPLVCKGHYTLMHTFSGVRIYTNSVGIIICLLFEGVSYDLKQRIGRGKIPRFLFVWFDIEETRLGLGI